MAFAMGLFLPAEPIRSQEVSTGFRHTRYGRTKGAGNLFIVQWRTGGTIEVEQMRSDSFAPECNIKIKANAITCERQCTEDGSKPAVDLQIDDSIDSYAPDQRGCYGAD